MKEKTRQRKKQKHKQKQQQKQKQKQRLESSRRRSTMMIGIENVEDLDKLLDLLRQDTRPLRDILAGFDSAFPLSLRVRLCNSLHLALEDKIMLSPTERLVAFSILHRTYASHSRSAKPFIHFLVIAARDDGAEKFERAFIVQLLESSSSSAEGFLKHSASDYVKGFDPSMHNFPALDQLQQQYSDGAHSDGAHPDTSTGETVKDLIAKAAEGELVPAQKEAHLLNGETVLMELSNDPKLVFHCGLTPMKIPDLVENNPVIAVEVLTKMINSPEFEEYFTILVSMEMSVHSIEVVYKLTQAGNLPCELLILCIHNCIVSCENIKDVYMQNKLARLVCVFIQLLIRNHHIDVEEVLIEVQAFCINFSRFREAAALFRLLKTKEG